MDTNESTLQNSHKGMKKWLIAVRPWSFPASAMPAIVGISFVFWQWHCQDKTFSVDWLNAVISLLGAITFQAAGNVISDYFDFKYHVDRKESFGSSRVLIDDMLTPRTLLRFGIIILVVAVGIGLFLFSRSGPHVLWIGLIGFLGTYFYYIMKYRAFGDLLIFIVYGQLIALGTVYVMTGSLQWEILAVATPTGLLVVNILHANNTRDILFDKKAHIRTFAMLIGIKGSKAQYYILAVGSYLIIAVLAALQILPYLSLGVLITLPLAIRNIKCMAHAAVEEPERIKQLDGMSAQLVLAFSLCLALSNFIAAFI
jgi:1,4-dihydroxy-2-naphthoate octaprenyltransferase